MLMDVSGTINTYRPTEAISRRPQEALRGNWRSMRKRRIGDVRRTVRQKPNTTQACGMVLFIGVSQMLADERCDRGKIVPAQTTGRFRARLLPASYARGARAGHGGA